MRATIFIGLVYIGDSILYAANVQPSSQNSIPTWGLVVAFIIFFTMDWIEFLGKRK